MNSNKAARRLLKSEPTSEASKTIAGLVLALQSEDGIDFKIASLYSLDLKTFEVAMEILHDWRLERYYNKKSKLYALARAVHGLAPIATADAADGSESDA
jgi:hypothetical protein